MSNPTHPTSDALSRLKRYAEQNAREPWIPVKATELLSLVQDAERLNSKTILVSGWDEFGTPQIVHHVGIDLRSAIDAAMEKRS